MELEAITTVETADETTPTPISPAQPLDRKAIYCLLLQHTSSSFNQRAFEFASYLYLITLFPDSLLLPSIFGLFTVLIGILGANGIGNLVDKTPRLLFIRSCIVLQKCTVALAYGLFLILFLRFRGDTTHPVVYFLFTLITISSALLGLTTIGISVSIERDWVTAIATEGGSDRLTLLNTYLRRIDLISKLVAPLFVSLLTTTVSYPFSVAFLLGTALITMIFEFVWINIVFNRFPILATEEKPRLEAQLLEKTVTKATKQHWSKSLKTSLLQARQDWYEFITLPVFPSSLSIALLYLMVLSFDGPMLSYLKSHNYTDAFLAGMRGIGVVAGLLGTVIMPIMEKKIGVIRTGTYSIIFELVWLLPVLVSFFYQAPPDGIVGSSLNSALLFSGMAISRIGLWSFDLSQLKVLQTSLQSHPRRNSLTALQYSLCNIVDLLKYVLTIILMKPNQFKWAAVVSVASVGCATITWLIYARIERGHLVHLEYFKLKKRK